MKTRKSTKRAFLLSVCSILLCLVMLIGTTFAWFTDTASTGVNKIQAGNLDIEVEYRTSSEEDWKILDNATDLFGAVGTLFEPGHTRVVELRITNAGNLALKYKIGMNVVSETAGTNKAGNPYNLSDYLKVATTGIQQYNPTDQISSLMEQLIFQKGDFGMWTARDFANFELEYTSNGMVHALQPGAAQILGIKVYMPETVGNEANAISTEKAASINFGLNVVATQYTTESDSYDNKYDKDAQYPITSFADLKAAVEWNGKYNVTEDLDPDASLIIKNAVVTLNATGKTIANTQDIYNAETYDWSMISVRGLGYLTITGGTFAAKENDCYVMDVRNGGYLTIEDGKFIGNVDAIYVENGTAVIEGGFFDIQQKLTGSTLEAQYKTLLNCNNGNYEAGNAKIIVKGGTFVNFDPSNNPEGEGTSFVADGYKVVSEVHGSDTWYTVVAK